VTLAALSPLTTVIAAANSQFNAAPAPAAVAGRKLLRQLGSRAEAVTPHRRRVLLQGLEFGVASEDGSPGNVSTSYGDALAYALEGDPAAYDLLSKNQELVCTGAVGGALLAALVGGPTATGAAAAAAVFDQLARDLLAGV
jgi:hypothetical protein